MTPDGVGEVIDFMPVGDPNRVTDRHRLVRVLRCVRGELAAIEQRLTVALELATVWREAPH